MSPAPNTAHANRPSLAPKNSAGASPAGPAATTQTIQAVEAVEGIAGVGGAAFGSAGGIATDRISISARARAILALGRTLPALILKALASTYARLPLSGERALLLENGIYRLA